MKLFKISTALLIASAAILSAAALPVLAASPDVSFEAYLSANQSYTSGSTAIVHFDSVYSNRGGAFATGSYRFTAPADGYYHFDVEALPLCPNTGAPYWHLWLYVNGAAARSSNSQNCGQGASISLSDTLWLAEGWYVEVYLSNQTGATQNVLATNTGTATWFSGHSVEGTADVGVASATLEVASSTDQLRNTVELNGFMLGWGIVFFVASVSAAAGWKLFRRGNS